MIMWCSVLLLSAGPLTQFPHSLEPHLRQLGLPVMLKRGLCVCVCVRVRACVRACMHADSLTARTIISACLCFLFLFYSFLLQGL